MRQDSMETVLNSVADVKLLVRSLPSISFFWVHREANKGGSWSAWPGRMVTLNFFHRLFSFWPRPISGFALVNFLLVLSIIVGFCTSAITSLHKKRKKGGPTSVWFFKSITRCRDYRFESISSSSPTENYLVFLECK